MTDDNNSGGMPGIDPDFFGRDPDPEVPNPAPEKKGDESDSPSPKDEYPSVATLEADLDGYGELHVIVEEYSDEVELRTGTTDFDYDSGLITVDDGQTLHRIGMERVVSWYFPTSMLH